MINKMEEDTRGLITIPIFSMAWGDEKTQEDVRGGEFMVFGKCSSTLLLSPLRLFPEMLFFPSSAGSSVGPSIGPSAHHTTASSLWAESLVFTANA